MKLLSDFQSLLHVGSTEDLSKAAAAVAESVGYSTFSLMVAIDQPDGTTSFANVNNTPTELVERFLDPEIGAVDPVMQYLKTNSVPLVWGQETYLEAGRINLWEEQSPYGFANGISLAIHMPGGRHVVLGVDRLEPHSKSSIELAQIVAQLQLAAVHLAEPSLRLLGSDARQPDATLSKRELEALKWTMEGKSAWEIGVILGVAERTVVMHINNACRKLDAVNKMQAVIKAIRWGFIA